MAYDPLTCWILLVNSNHWQKVIQIRLQFNWLLRLLYYVLYRILYLTYKLKHKINNNVAIYCLALANGQDNTKIPIKSSIWLIVLTEVFGVFSLPLTDKKLPSQFKGVFVVVS